MKNYVLIVEYECGSCGFLTDHCELTPALDEYNRARLELLKDHSNHISMPVILGARLYRLFK